VRAIAVREAVRVARRGQAGRTVTGALATYPHRATRSLPPMFAACWQAWRLSTAVLVLRDLEGLDEQAAAALVRCHEAR
jgi:hypothetical protein